MFGISYLKSGPTQYVLHYKNGNVKREGTGLTFFYYRPISEIAIVPVGSADAPFIFTESSSDFQTLTVQGQITYRVRDAKLVASLLNYVVNPATGQYASNDPEKLPQRLVNLTQVMIRSEISAKTLRDATQASDSFAKAVLDKLANSEALKAMGIEVITLAILAIKPIPEMARALEASARENLYRQADDAIYDRRNAAVEQERRIKENELNTQIAIEEKQRKIRETKVEADLAVETKEQQVREAKLGGQIKLEIDSKQLVEANSANVRVQADNQAYAVEQSLKHLKTLDKDVLQLLGMQSADPRLMVSLALKEIAQNAGKIGQLNISPDLLTSLMAKESA